MSKGGGVVGKVEDVGAQLAHNGVFLLVMGKVITQLFEVDKLIRWLLIILYGQLIQAR